MLQINSKLKTTFKSSSCCHASLDLDLSNFSIGDIFYLRLFLKIIRGGMRVLYTEIRELVIQEIPLALGRVQRYVS